MNPLRWVTSVPDAIVELGVGRPKLVVILAAIITVVLGALMVRV